MAKYSQEDLGKYAFEIVPQLSSKLVLELAEIFLLHSKLHCAGTLFAQSRCNIVGFDVWVCMAM